MEILVNKEHKYILYTKNTTFNEKVLKKKYFL